MDERRAMYGDHAELYDLIYAFKDFEADAKEIAGLLRAEGVPESGRVLDVACGTGTTLSHLADSFDIAGLDVSPDMLRFARTKLPDADFFMADMADFEVPEPFDAVLCLFSSIGYVQSEAQLHAAARCFARACRPGGVLVVEPWITPEDWRIGEPHLQTYDSPDLKLARANVSRREGDLAILDFDWLVVRRDVGVEHFQERHVTRLYTQEQMVGAFEAAGFEVRWEATEFRGRYVGRKGV